MTNTALDKARRIALAYRRALQAVDPQRATEIDAKARELGQWWAAPTELAPDAAEALMGAELSPVEIEQSIGIAAGTVRVWANRGLLTNHGEKGRPRFRVVEVLEIEARNRKSAA